MNWGGVALAGIMVICWAITFVVWLVMAAVFGVLSIKKCNGQKCNRTVLQFIGNAAAALIISFIAIIISVKLISDFENEIALIALPSIAGMLTNFFFHVGFYDSIKTGD